MVKQIMSAFGLPLQTMVKHVSAMNDLNSYSSEILKGFAAE